MSKPSTKKMTGMLRSLLKGKAVDWQGDHPQVMSNRAVWKFWKLAPTALEMTVRRLRWYQDWIRHLDDHRQVVASILGRFQFDSDEDTPLDGEGRVRATANPWAKQFVNDINQLREVSDTEEFFEHFQGRVPLLWTEDIVSELFLAIDVRQLRNKFWTSEWAPAGELGEMMPTQEREPR